MKTTTTFTLPDLPKFEAKKKFTNGFYLGYNFKEHFLPKVEPKSTGGKFKLTTLEKPMVDKDIIAELGSSHIVTLGQLYEFLKTADKDGWYIAYIEDAKGELWAVCCLWDFVNQEWIVAACSVALQIPWLAGYQVCSHDSSKITGKLREMKK